MNNPIPISSNITESHGKDPNVFHSSGNAALNSIVSTHGKAPFTSSTFSNNSIDGNAPNTSNNGNAPKSNGNAPIPPLKNVVILQKLEKLGKKVKTRDRNKNTYLVAVSKNFSRLNFVQNIFFTFSLFTSFDLISEHSICLTPLTYYNLKDLFPMT